MTEARARLPPPQTLTQMDPSEDVTSLKLIGFSIEVQTDPVTLLMQTDEGPFSVEIPKTELSNLVYALQIVSYADEPLQRKRLKRQAEARSLYGSVGDPKEKGEATPITKSSAGEGEERQETEIGQTSHNSDWSFKVQTESGKVREI